MKIAAWNVERLKHKLDKIIYICEQIGADILILTETDQRIKLNYNYSFHTSMMSEIEPENYKNTENRVSIFTNYECICRHTTFDKYTAICVELETEMGNLLVYGTIIGIYGNRHPSFLRDLTEQTKDFKRLSQGDNSLCICGDYNCSFQDNYNSKFCVAAL